MRAPIEESSEEPSTIRTPSWAVQDNALQGFEQGTASPPACCGSARKPARVSCTRSSSCSSEDGATDMTASHTPRAERTFGSEANPARGSDAPNSPTFGSDPHVVQAAESCASLDQRRMLAIAHPSNQVQSEDRDELPASRSPDDGKQRGDDEGYAMASCKNQDVLMFLVSSNVQDIASETRELIEREAASRMCARAMHVAYEELIGDRLEPRQQSEDEALSQELPFAVERLLLPEVEVKTASIHGSKACRKWPLLFESTSVMKSPDHLENTSRLIGRFSEGSLDTKSRQLFRF